MKKLLSLILTITMLCYMAITAFAEKIQNYEYILPMEYTKIERCQNCYIAYDKQDKCAIYDLNGKKLSDDYDYIGSFFNEQVAEARKDNQYYIINPYGTVLGKFDKRIINVSEYVLVNLTDSNEDGRPLSYFEGEFGVYTYTGDLVKVLSYEEFKPPKNWGFWITFAGGRMLFTENGKWGAVDSSFNTFIEPIYDKIYPFTDAESRITTAIKDGKYGLIDQDGKTAADFVYDEMYPIYDSNNGKINAYKVMQNLTQKPQFGLLDRYGKTIKQLGELEPQTLYEDYKLIKVSKRNNRDDSDQYEYLYGLIGYDGNIVIPVENTNIWGISEGVVAAQKAEDQNGYYDINGREITDFKYIAVSLFSEGLAFASSFTGGVWTHEVINKNGEALFNPSNWSGGFCGGIAQIEAGKFIDANGNIIIDNPEWTAGPELNRRNYKDDGRFIVSDGENCGVAKYTGFISPWAKETISEAKRLNIIKTDANYNYTAFISREEFCELVFNYIKNFPGSAFSVGIIKPPFTDTDNEHIEVLNALGIIKGKSETEFAPNDSLTREEAAAILCRLINKIYPGWDATAQYFDFADSGQISDWAMNDIQVICNMGIMQGVGDNRFAPKELYTTEQAIATLARVYNNFSKSNDISNAENLSYSQIEDLQESVNNGHFPWRLDYKQVIMNFLSDKGEKAENGELVAFAGDGEKCSGNYKIGSSIYTLELFKPIDKSGTGIWIVKSCAKKDVIGGVDGETEISVSDLTFADKLNAQMPADKNYMFSPLSVKMALALAANGAEGYTKDETLNTLGVKNLDEFNTFSKNLIKRYSQTDILSLNIANSIWINKDKTTQNFSKNFKNIATEYYNADVKTVYNKNAVSEINSWVKDKTKGKIPQIIDNADNFWAMLINAIYFKGAWENEFSTSLTKPDEFTNADGTKTQTDFMNKTNWIPYAETKSAKIIELPYKNRVDKFSDSGEHIDTDSFDDLDVSMYLMLANSGINAEREFNAAINGKSFERTYTKLSIPKFKIEYSERLNDTLKNIGIKTAFDTKTARFEKMFDSGNMWFTDTIHKTFISVDEKGTEAAAVTSIGMGGSALPPEPIELKFNKPFYFAIRDNTSGEILFMGRYAFAE